MAAEVVTGSGSAPHGDGRNDEARAWAAAAQAGDRAAFDAIVRNYQHRVVAHLLNRHRLSHDEALDLTQQTMLLALRKLLAGGEPVAQVGAWLIAIANRLALEHFRRHSREVPAEGSAFDPLPDQAALSAFVDADRDLDRDLAVRRNLPTFLGLMHAAVESLPVKEREVIRTQWALAEVGQLDVDRPSPQTIDELVTRYGISREEASRRIHDARRALPEVAAALLISATRRTECQRLDRYLTEAGWTQGMPFGEALRQRVRQHVNTCSDCKAQRDKALRRISSLPAFMPLLLIGLEDQRLRLAETACHLGMPPGAGGSADGSPRPRVDVGQPMATGAAQTDSARGRRRLPVLLLAAAVLGVGGWWAAADRQAPAGPEVPAAGAPGPRAEPAPASPRSPGRDRPAGSADRLPTGRQPSDADPAPGKTRPQPGSTPPADPVDPPPPDVIPTPGTDPGEAVVEADPGQDGQVADSGDDTVNADPLPDPEVDAADPLPNTEGADPEDEQPVDSGPGTEGTVVQQQGTGTDLGPGADDSAPMERGVGGCQACDPFLGSLIPPETVPPR
ncbi:MAG: hypothetical protein QOE58_1269 [Actinomycetota bacterium]|nr:hypothetical protein [Actinomycetota bacterium]